MLGKTHFTNRIIWILLAFFGWYILLGDICVLLFERFYSGFFPHPSDGLAFINSMYAPLFASCVFFLALCAAVGKNRFMLDIIKPTKERKSLGKFGTGVLLGFLTNFFCIVCALLHGDIKLYFGFSAAQIPLMIYAFICVFFQSTSEELWCRCFMYERINVHYPLWVAMVVNAAVFGGLHSFNDGITALAMTDLILCGLFYSLLRWYSGSIWTCFGIHTMWNFTQNFIFGLPNSGLVSQASIFHMDAVNAVSNWCYSYEFGVEGAVPAVLMEVLPIIVILVMAKKTGRLGELLESRESRGLEPVAVPKNAVNSAPVVEFAEAGDEPVEEFAETEALLDKIAEQEAEKAGKDE